jgi:hypothetical protein
LLLGAKMNFRNTLAATLSLVVLSAGIAPAFATMPDGTPHEQPPTEQPQDGSPPAEQPQDGSHEGPSDHHPMGGGHIPQGGGDTDNSIKQDISADANQQQGQGQQQKATGGKSESDATSYGSQQGQGQSVDNSGNSSNSNKNILKANGGEGGAGGNGGEGGKSDVKTDVNAAGGAGGMGGSLENSGNSQNDIKTEGGKSDSSIKDSGNGIGVGVGGTGIGGSSSSEGGKSDVKSEQNLHNQNDIKSEGGKSQNDITTQGGAGGSSSSEGGKSDVKTDVKADGGSAQNGPQTTNVGPNTSTSSSGGNTIKNGSSSNNGGVSLVNSTSNKYPVAPSVALPGNLQGTSLQNFACVNGQVITTNDYVGPKDTRFGFGVHAVSLSFGSTSQSKNEAYYSALAAKNQTRAELMTADGVASHPLGGLFLSENTLNSVAMSGKVRHLNTKDQMVLNRNASNAVQATIVKSKSGSVAMGCGKVQGGGQIIIDQPQPQQLPQPQVVPPIVVPTVPTVQIKN